MNAKPNDDLRVTEIYQLISEVRGRAAALGLTFEKFAFPKGFAARNTAEGFQSCIYRISEEAYHLSFAAQKIADEMPWDQIRGFRNQLAHNYGGTEKRIVWHVFENELDSLENFCEQYAAIYGLDLETGHRKPAQK